MRLIDADKLIQLIPSEEIIARIAITNAPTVTPDMAQVLAYESGKANSSRPTGKWMKCDFHDFGARVEWNYKCANCEAVYGMQYNYCPNCGARMEAENERT